MPTKTAVGDSLFVQPAATKRKNEEENGEDAEGREGDAMLPLW